MKLTDKVNEYLGAIEAKKDLNAFLDVYADEALARAAEVESKMAAGTAGPLAGMVIGLKDVLAHKGHGLQAGSKILSGFKSQFTGTAVQRLIDADAVIIGRQNCDEFAMGSSNENSAFGPVRNAADPTRVSGGSSGGSAVSVQAGLCDASIGSDTGGSVRQPAAFCGVYGLKPTYSRISRWGLVAYGSSFDCIGPFAKNLEDLGKLLTVMAGPDDNDATVSRRPVENYTPGNGLEKKARFGVPRQAVEGAGLHPDVSSALNKAMDRLRAAGHNVEVYDFPMLDYLLPCYYILTTAEASSNLARYDGVKYGYRDMEALTLEDMYKNTRSKGFGAEVKRRIFLGTFVLSANYYDAYFTKAQRVRRLIKDENERLLSNFDFLLMPTTPSPAFKIGEKTEDPIEMYLADIFTVQANVTGQAGLSIPAGTTAEGLPIGLQLMGRHFEENDLLKAGRELERVMNS